MDYDKLIERLIQHDGIWCSVATGYKLVSDAALASVTLRDDLARVTAERDAAVSDLELFATCDTCKFGEMKMADDCLGCDHASNWKWRGIKED